MKRLVAALVVVASLTLSMPASVAATTHPTPMDRALFNFACVHLAGGTVSAQVALVCTHESPPSWDARSQRVMQVLCERLLTGTYVRRAQYPTEYAACFFD